MLVEGSILAPSLRVMLSMMNIDLASILCIRHGRIKYEMRSLLLGKAHRHQQRSHGQADTGLELLSLRMPCRHS